MLFVAAWVLVWVVLIGCLDWFAGRLAGFVY